MRTAVLLVAALAGCSFAPQPGSGATPQDGQPITGDAPHDDAKVGDGGSDAFVPPDAPPTRFGFIQGVSNDNLTGGAKSYTLKLAAAQVAGDLDIVATNWQDDTALVASVTDSDGNTFTAATDQQIFDNVGGMAVFVATNTKPGGSGGDTITVTFTKSVIFAGVAAEYAGLATTSPIDVTQLGSGQSGTADSGTKSTTHAHDIVIGVIGATTGITAGSGYASRVTDTFKLNLIEDHVDTAVASEHATATLGVNSTVWLAQMIALKAAN